jgi:hypothetical protein
VSRRYRTTVAVSCCAIAESLLVARVAASSDREMTSAVDSMVDCDRNVQNLASTANPVQSTAKQQLRETTHFGTVVQV